MNNKTFLLRQVRDRTTHFRIWVLAAPMMLSNVSIALLGLIDTAVIGHLANPSYLAGISLATVLFDFLYWGVTFLRMGTTGVVAQNYGSGDAPRAGATLRDAMIIALILALLMLVARHEIRDFGLQLLDGSITATTHASHFFEIKIWGAPGVLATMVFIGWLIGMQKARVAMVLVAIPCLVHAGLDLLFVVGFKLGITGAAYASLITAYFSASLGGWLVVTELRRHSSALAFTWQWRSMRRLLTFNWNIMLRTFCLIATFAFFTRRGASWGDTTLAANAILLNFQMLTALALDGFANALEAMVGRSIGALNRTRFLAAVTIGMLWSIIFALLFVGLYALFGSSLIASLTDIPELRAEAARFMVWAVISPIISVWCFVFDGIFIGATKGREMRNSIVFSTFFVFLPGWYLLQPLGNHGLWLAFLMFFAARGASMAWYFLKLERQGEFL